MSTLKDQTARFRQSVEDANQNTVGRDKDSLENRPMTKEGLYFRQIFDEHYPKRSRIIPKFWMPNRYFI